MSSVQKVIKTGNSLAITIPSSFAKIIGVIPGQEVTAQVDVLAGTLLFTFTNSAQLPLLGPNK